MRAIIPTDTCCQVASVMSDSVRPHRRQPTRLPRPWDSPGKNTGVGCHFLLQCIKVKSEREVAQSCPTPSDPMDCSPPGSSVHGIFQARVLEWVAMPFCRASSPPRDQTSVSCIAGRFFTVLAIAAAAAVASVVSDSVRPHRQQPSRLPCPWDSPGKNTGGGCHFLLQCMKVKSESEVTQSCPTLSDPMDWSPPGSSVHGIFQARVLEWGAIAFSVKCTNTF